MHRRTIVWLAASLSAIGAAPRAHAQGFIEITPTGSAVTSSTSDVNVPANSVDNDPSTRWSGNGDGAWIAYDLGSVRTVASVSVAVYQGTSRSNRFDLQVSTDKVSWTTVWSGQSSGTTTAQETYDFPDVAARHVRYVGHGTATSPWNSVTELDVFGR